MNRFERFCQRNERFGIKNLMTIIVAGQGVMGLLLLMLELSGGFAAILWIRTSFVFLPEAFLRGEVWRLITCLFVPETMDSGLGFILFVISLLFYFWVGRTLEATFGRLKFTIYYFSGVLLALLFSLGFYLIFGIPAPAELMFLNLSLFFALATLMPDTQIRLYFILPIKIKYMAWVLAAIYVVLPILNTGNFPANLFPLLYILNYLIFFASTLLGMLRRAPRRVKASRRTVQFKSEVRRAKSQRGYIHKCAACGRTDTELPDMEFRYCSLCAGYACYCADHIFNHDHKSLH